MTRKLNEFVKEHYDSLAAVRMFWNGLLFKGEQRAPNAPVHEAIRHIYKRAGFSYPEVLVSDNPLANTINYMELHAKRKREKRFLKRNEDTLVLSFILQDMINTWNSQISATVSDFRLFDTAKEKMRCATGNPFTLDIFLSYYDCEPVIRQLFPARWNGIHSAISAAAHTILCQSLLQENINPESFQREYYQWTGISGAMVPEFILRRNRHPRLLKALWANHGAELNHLYNLLPIYDFFYETGILQDEDFAYVRQLFRAGIASIEPFEDVCLVSRLPIAVSISRNRIHADKLPAVVYAGGMQLYYAEGYHYPASWLLHPDTVDHTALRSLQERPLHSVLFQLLGAEQLSNILGAVVLAHIHDEAKDITLYKAEKPPGKLSAPLYFLKVQEAGSEDYDFQCLSPASVKKILTGRLKIGGQGTMEEITMTEKMKHYVASGMYDQQWHYNPFQQQEF